MPLVCVLNCAFKVLRALWAFMVKKMYAITVNTQVLECWEQRRKWRCNQQRIWLEEEKRIPLKPLRAKHTRLICVYRKYCQVVWWFLRFCGYCTRLSQHWECSDLPRAIFLRGIHWVHETEPITELGLMRKEDVPTRKVHTYHLWHRN